MLFQLLSLCILLLFLFLFSKRIMRTLYKQLFLLTRSKTISVWILAIMFIPGTIMHELSHFLLATILRVPTGELTIFPSIEKTGEIRAGRLIIGKSDPIRHTLIGVAPMMIGLGIMYALGTLYFPSNISTQPIQTNQLWFFLFSFLLTNTMFSSKKDLESFVIVAPIMLLFIFAIFASGVKISLTGSSLHIFEAFLQNLNLFLLLSSACNFLILLILMLHLSLWEKILKKRVVS